LFKNIDVSFIGVKRSTISSSEVVITTFFIIILLLECFVIIFIFVFNVLFGVVIIWLEVTVGLGITWLPLVSEPVLGLAHLVVTILKHGIFFISLIIEDFFLFGLDLLTLEFVNDILLILSTEAILDVVHIELELQVVDVGELFDISVIEPLKLRFQALILLLIFRLDILNTLESLLSSLEFLLSSIELVQEFTFVKLKLLHGIFHFSHFPGLIINDVSNTLLDVLLLSVGVKVS